uniref:Uncharacterized protein n=1 Tax=Setaria digitata TaxID=48799 RepID=A0A915PI38_9BILA
MWKRSRKYTEKLHPSDSTKQRGQDTGQWGWLREEWSGRMDGQIHLNGETA